MAESLNPTKPRVPVRIAAVALVLLAGLLVKKVFFEKPFDYAGTLEATRINLPARVPSVIHSIAVHEGDSVAKDQILATQACEDIALTRSLAEENYQRAVRLKETGSISREAYDQAQNRKQDADTRLGWCEIKSPVNGTVLTRFLEPSEWANPGTRILTVADLSDLWANFYVPQEQMSRLKVGTKVTGRVPELNRTFNGTIIKINDEAEFTPKNVQTESERTRLIFGVKVSFANPERALKPGVTILSTLTTAQAK